MYSGHSDGSRSAAGRGSSSRASAGLGLPLHSCASTEGTNTADASLALGYGSLEQVQFLQQQQQQQQQQQHSGAVTFSSPSRASDCGSSSSSGTTSVEALGGGGRFCHPGQHQAVFPGAFEPQPHVTVSYSGGGGGSGGGGAGGSALPLLPGQNPHHPAWGLHPALPNHRPKQHPPWMADYHGFVSTAR